MKKLTTLLLLLAACTVSVYAVKGASPGVFSVSPTKKIVFSMGNLEYQPSTQTWQFHREQFDTIGQANANIDDPNYEGWIDLFGWGTGDAPTKAATDADYSTFTDWGTNTISTSGNIAQTWYTMSREEWMYLLRGRPNAEKLFALATVRGVKGLLLLPDKWIDSHPTNPTVTPTTEQGMEWDEANQFFGGLVNNYYAKNVIDSAQWFTLQLYNAVFLPAAGLRQGSGEGSVTSVDAAGRYWMSDAATDNKAKAFNFSMTTIYPGKDFDPYLGHSVRLVAECVDTISLFFEKPEPKATVPTGQIFPSSSQYNQVGKVSLPDNARYNIVQYAYYSTDGNSITDTKFSPNTSYMVQVIVEVKPGYTFPTSRGSDYPSRYSMELIVNDEVLGGSNYSYWNNGRIGLCYIFTTDESDDIANPVFSSTAYAIVDTASIAITCGTPGVSIYYTTNGATPNKLTGTLYTQPVFIDAAQMKDKTTLTLKAIAYRDDEASEVVSYTYHLARTESTIVLRYNDAQGTASAVEKALYGDQVTVDVKPAIGYKLDGIRVNGVAVLGGTTFTVPAHRSTIYVDVDFEQIEQADPTETTSITITPSDNSVTVVWPAVDGAATYELVIKDAEGNVVCTLVFNAAGQLTSINFVPSKRSNAPQHTQSAGFSFLVNGLEKAAAYSLTLTAKDDQGTVLDEQVRQFATTGGSITSINAVPQIDTNTRKVMKNGQLLIICGDKVYNATGQELK